MNTEEKRLWGIHTNDESLFLQNDIIAIGWPAMGDLCEIEGNRTVFKTKYAQVYPYSKKGTIASGAGMLYRFAHEVQKGDYVAFPSRSDRRINLGIIEGDCSFNASAHEYVHQRKVKWLKHIPRMAFSQGALYEIGSAMAFFSIKNYSDEFFAALDPSFKKTGLIADNEEDDSVAATADDIIETTKDFILKELSKNLKGYNLEDFVADLLNSMGYRTTVSAHGGDSGIDITAYKDELPPRILVQVKSQDGDIKETTIQSLKGAMREGDYGLFVTLSNYTAKAQKYLAGTPIIRGINGSELADLVLRYDDQMSEKYQKMIPLKRVFIPVAREHGE